MMNPNDNPDWDFKDRDRLILRELAGNPQLTSREISKILKEDGVETSHATVSKSIRNMREAGVFREAIIPNEEYLFFGLFEFQFNPSEFENSWRAAMEDIRTDPHTLMYFLSDGEYQWKTVMMFKDREQESKWIHDFYKNHGEVVNQLRNSVVTNVLKFRADPRVFELLEG